MADELSPLFQVELKRPVCIPGLTEDDLNQLVRSLLVTVSDPNFAGFVRSTSGTDVKFNFDSAGNWSGVTAKINSQNVELIPGVGSGQMEIFKGPPSASYPGAGWQIEVDLTKSILSQPENENQWTAFLASRVGVINTI